MNKVITIIYNSRIFEIPKDLERRFFYLTRKIDIGRSHPDFIEMSRGYSIILNGEFGTYERKS